MLNIFVKDLGLGYKEGDVLTWTATQLNNLDAVSGATTNAVVTLSTFDIKQLPVLETPDLAIALDSNQGVYYSESINNFRLMYVLNFHSYFSNSIYLYTKLCFTLHLLLCNKRFRY